MKPRHSAQLSFQDTMDGFDFDALELFRPQQIGLDQARGRLVQAAMEQNHQALSAVLDACLEAVRAKNTTFLHALMTTGKFQGARTGPTGKVAEIQGKSSPIGSLALASLYANTKDAEAQQYEKRFSAFVARLPDAAREKILSELLSNGRDARHARQISKLLVRATQWHPQPAVALQQLACAKAFPHLKVPMADVTGAAITAGLKKLGPDETKQVFESNAHAFMPVYVRQGGFKNSDLDELAESHVLKQSIESFANPTERSRVAELVDKHGRESGPLTQMLVDALGLQIQRGNLDAVERFGPMIQRASQAGQFLFLKTTVGDAPMLDALIGIKAHEHPTGVNLATAMLSRHMVDKLDPSHAPAIFTLIKAGADPFQKFARGKSSTTDDGAFTRAQGLSLHEMLKQEKGDATWKALGNLVNAAKAKRAVQSPKKPRHKAVASALP